MTRARGTDGVTRPVRSDAGDVGRPSERRSVLLPARGRGLTLEKLLQRGERPLTRVLETACGWAVEAPATWEVGDFNVLVLSTRPRRGVTLYVRWWSEPMEPVAAEVCALRGDPSASRFLSREGRVVLRRLGYRVGGRQRNFRKVVVLDGPEATSRMAREALTVFHDVFGYRGRTPLEVQLVRDGRSRPALVHDALTAEDVARLVMAGGDLAEVKIADSGQPVVFATGDSPWLVHLPWRTSEPSLFAGLHFYRLLPRPVVLDAEIVNRINSGLLFGKIVVDADDDLAVTMDVRVDGGVTTEWLAQVLRQWREVIAEVDVRLTVAKESLATMAAAAKIVSAKGLLQE